MNLVNKKWLNVKGKKITNLNKTTEFERKNFYVIPKIFKKKSDFLKINFEAEYDNFTSIPVLKILNKNKQVIAEVECNSEALIDLRGRKYYFMLIFTSGKSKFKITKLTLSKVDSNSNVLDYFLGNILLVTPGYPSVGNKYMCGFVHTRVLEYLKLNMKVDVCVVGNFTNVISYEYENVKVIKLPYYLFRELLTIKQYDKIFIHFFNELHANVLDKVNLINTKVYLYSHGAETLYWDWPIISGEYFKLPPAIDEELRDLFLKKDMVIKKYNHLNNVKWFFVTPWTKKRSEELLNIKYNNYDIIPCNINTKLFKYVKKDPELRKKIFVLRKFDNPNTYSLDIVVRVILELSRRDIFDDLEFNIYGDGSLFDLLTGPIKNFSNVNLNRTFLTHEEIKKVHDQNGIALFPTRYDSQAISVCEAASSGLVVVSTINPGIIQEIDPKYNTLCHQENYKEYADVIERLYNNPDEFLSLSKNMSEDIKNIYGYNQTIKKELDILNSNDKCHNIVIDVNNETPVLTILIPAYNVEKYIGGTLYSLINQKNANKLEILVINDGSVDNTEKAVKDFIKKVDNGNKIIKLINKENGGHGSALNVGLEKATGKYLKIIDGDDTFNSDVFGEFIDILEKQDADIVLNNYVQDFANENISEVVKLYSFMIPGLKYKFDDLCYSGYGFDKWGPLLSTSTYKVDCLRKRKFAISEKIFYDDMEWNLQTVINCDTIVYYDMDIYNYLLGREGQSVSLEVLKKRYGMHRQMIMKLISIYNDITDISSQKRLFIEDKIIRKMIITHYEMVIDSFTSYKPFIEFEKELKSYSYFYNCVNLRKIKLCRKTHGILILLNKFKSKRS